jgi:hypothetical protein
MRGLVLTAFLLGLCGTAIELLMVGHTETFWQLLPLLLIGISVVPLAFFVRGRVSSRAVVSLRIFQAIMFLFMISGVVGLFLHYDSKVEFKRESDPSLAGWVLFREAMKSAMPPALAPAAMIQFGLLGLAYIYRHPAISPKQNGE